VVVRSGAGREEVKIEIVIRVFLAEGRSAPGNR